MNVQIQCECGKRYRTKAKFAGRKVKCPSCSKLILITGTRSDPNITLQASKSRQSNSISKPCITDDMLDWRAKTCLELAANTREVSHDRSVPTAHFS